LYARSTATLFGPIGTVRLELALFGLVSVSPVR
jgi:hypothetical protein